jgi:hypothetical protein
MENTARNDLMMHVLEDISEYLEDQDHTECDIVEFRLKNQDHDSLYENFVNEIDAWARQAIASNGFGDY